MEFKAIPLIKGLPIVNLGVRVLIGSTINSSTKLISNKLIDATIIKKYEKNITVLFWPNSINEDSTCLAPKTFKINKLAINI